MNATTPDATSQCPFDEYCELDLPLAAVLATWEASHLREQLNQERERRTMLEVESRTLSHGLGVVARKILPGAMYRALRRSTGGRQ